MQIFKRISSTKRPLFRELFVEFCVKTESREKNEKTLRAIFVFRFSTHACRRLTNIRFSQFEFFVSSSHFIYIFLLRNSKKKKKVFFDDSKFFIERHVRARACVCVHQRKALSAQKLTKTTERLNPALSSFAFSRIESALTTPAANLLIMRRFNNVGDVTTWINL